MSFFVPKQIALLVGVFLFSCSSVESSALIKSPPNTDLSSILSMLFSCESVTEQLKYDKATEDWVEECPELDCKHGKDEGDEEMCPSCLLGPGDECGDWKGECGEEMICQYPSAYSCSGKCVLLSEFNSRKGGDACGHWEGECGEGFKCQREPDCFGFLFGIENSGICVTDEMFSSRLEGESCGGSAGECGEGLTCVDEDWFTSVCKNLTEGNGTESSDSAAGMCGFGTIIAESLIGGTGEPEEHIHVEVYDNSHMLEEDNLLESVLKKDLESIFASDQEKEEKIIGDILESAFAESTASSFTSIDGDDHTEAGAIEEEFDEPADDLLIFDAASEQPSSSSSFTGEMTKTMEESDRFADLL